MNLTVTLISLGAFAMTLSGGYFADRFKDRFNLAISSFAAGAVLSVACFDLAPESIEAARTYHSTMTILLVMTGAFLLYAVLNYGQHSNKHHLGASTLVLHSLFDGVSIGLASFVAGVLPVVSAAVLAHDFSDGINTFNVVLKSNGKRKHAITWLWFDALAPVVGANVIRFFTPPNSIVSIILAILSGFLFYIGIHLFSHVYRESPLKKSLGWVVLGGAFIFVVVHIAKLSGL